MSTDNDHRESSQPSQSRSAATDPTKLAPASEPLPAAVPASSVASGKTTVVDGPQDLPGKLLGGRYFIEKELGHGGVGAVYLGRDRKLHNKPVVVKILLEKSLRDPWVVQKFQQEKEALARVDHPGVVGILDTGELPDGKPYIVMQYVDGAPLRSVMSPHGMGLERAASIVKQIGAALSAVHDKGIYHRDLKPENIMLQRLGGSEEQVKVVDFGIAKIKRSDVAQSTATGGVTAGTIAYMSPEQLRGEKVGAASDIYAMGVIAYEMVTGRRPFNPETPFELLEMQRAGARVQPVDLRPSLSAEAQTVILKALSFDPKGRYQSAREFGDPLARALMNEGETVELGGQRAEVPPTQPSKDQLPPMSPADSLGKTIPGRFEPARPPPLNRSVFPSSAAVDEIVETEREVERPRGLARVSQIVDYLFYVVYALLGLRFLLALMAARSTSGFVRFIVAVTDPFYEPFRGIVASPRTDGLHTLMVPLIVAFIAYVLLHLGINGLLRLIAHRKTAI